MSIGRDDRWCADAQGRALAGTEVYWCTEPATAPSVPPPSPLATIYSDLNGTPLTQPVIADGFGHAVAYLTEGVLFTVVMYHPLFGDDPIVIPDQMIGGGGGGGNLQPFAGTPTGTIDGSNKVFTVVNGSTPLTALPAQITAWLNFPLIEGLGYTLAVVGGQLQITFANAPKAAAGGSAADAIYAQGLFTP